MRLTFIEVPWHPILIAAAYVLNLWTESGVSFLAMVRPLVLAVALMAVGLVVVSVLSRRPHLAGTALLFAFVLLISRGPIYFALAVVLSLAVVLALLIAGRIRRRPVAWPVVTRALNGFALLVLLVVFVGGITRGTFAALPADLQQGRGDLTGHAQPAGAAGGPDVLILMLDGYPRADWYARLFGGDNQPFIAALEERGFEVAENSTSNYMFTELTLASMLHMRPVREIERLEPALSGTVPGQPLMRTVVNDNPVFAAFRDRGYRVVTSSPGYEHVALRRSDVYLDGGQLTDFEYHLLRSTTLQHAINALAPRFFADQLRDRIRSGFEHFTDIATDVGPPTFGFVHVPTPHLPVAFDESGMPAPLPPSGDIFGLGDDDQLPADAYVSQLQFINGEVLSAVDRAIAARADRREAVIVVMSDHGAATRPEVFEGDGGPEHYANLFAVLTPGGERLFGEESSPVNLFPKLLNHYFGTAFPTWPDERYEWVPPSQ